MNPKRKTFSFCLLGALPGLLLCLLCRPASGKSLPVLEEMVKKSFQLMTVQKGTSTEMYVVQLVSGVKHYGDDVIVLSKFNRRMAIVQVLKTYVDQKMFIVKVLKYYGGKTGLALKETYDASPMPEREIAEIDLDVHPPYKELSAMTALGFSTTSYSESGVTNYSMISLDAHLGLRERFSFEWGAEQEIFLNLFALSHHNADSFTSSSTARALGFNLRGSYTVGHFTFYGGYFFRTSFVSDQAFGFKNVTGLNLFPEFQWQVRSADRLTFQIRYSPLLNGIKPLALDNRELGLGASWFHWLNDEKQVFATFDVSNLKFAVGSTAIQYTSVGLYGGYLW